MSEPKKTATRDQKDKLSAKVIEALDWRLLGFEAIQYLVSRKPEDFTREFVRMTKALRPPECSFPDFCKSLMFPDAERGQVFDRDWVEPAKADIDLMLSQVRSALVWMAAGRGAFFAGPLLNRSLEHGTLHYFVSRDRRGDCKFLDSWKGQYVVGWKDGIRHKDGRFAFPVLDSVSVPNLFQIRWLYAHEILEGIESNPELWPIVLMSVPEE